MSFQEKTIAASLVTMLLVWGYYFLELYQARVAGTLSFTTVKGLLVAAVILTIVISIIVHSIVAAASTLAGDAPGEDERDKLIGYKASHLSSYLLGAGVISTVLVAVFTDRLVPTVNTLVGFFVLSELARYTLQLLFYRRGV